MKLFPQKKSRSAAAGEDPAVRLKDSENRCRLYTEALRALLSTLETLVDPAADADADACRKAVNTLSEAFAAERDAGKLAACLAEQHGIILSFFQRQRGLLREKEKEYKDIIALLTKAMADVNADNHTFTERISQQTDQMERLTRLEDIKTLKSALVQEVAGLRGMIQEKQAQDEKAIQALSEQVSSLKTELDASRQASMRDGLTGLYNETALNRYLKTLTQPGGHGPFSMMVVDIDKFDRIEGTYGAALGQRVILAASHECRTVFIRDEFMARYQRGTFVVVLPAVSLKPAVQKAKDLCRAIAQKRYQIDEGLEGHTLAFTVSVGVSAYRRQDTSAAVISRAVQALASARRSGAGQVAGEKTAFLKFKGGGTQTIEDLYS